jgi:hypothetical protein
LLAMDPISFNASGTVCQLGGGVDFDRYFAAARNRRI